MGRKLFKPVWLLGLVAVFFVAGAVLLAFVDVGKGQRAAVA